jgi:hypothetical protein
MSLVFGRQGPDAGPARGEVSRRGRGRPALSLLRRRPPGDHENGGGLTGKTRTFETSIEIDAPPEMVWRALTEAEELTRHFPLEGA